MRLWTLHPKYLDRQGLLAVWREGLLAQAVLQGKTKGYTRHPQLLRFQNQTDPLLAIGCYLEAIYQEATQRGYHFKAEKIEKTGKHDQILTTEGQLAFEEQHLKRKLSTRSPAQLEALTGLSEFEPHPLFRPIPGETEAWERGGPVP